MRTSLSAVAKIQSIETTASWISFFFWSVPIEGSLFFIRLDVTLSLLKPSLLFKKELLDFKRGSELIQLKW